MLRESFDATDNELHGSVGVGVGVGVDDSGNPKERKLVMPSLHLSMAGVPCRPKPCLVLRSAIVCGTGEPGDNGSMHSDIG